jgi:tetratricopeptide (TPR) repeat protein
LLPKEELEFYKTIYDQTAFEPAERFVKAMARKRAGLIRLKLGEFDGARLCFTLAIHMLEELAVEKPQPELDPIYRRTLAETHADYAAYLAAMGESVAAEAQYDAGLTLLSKLIEKQSDDHDSEAEEARIWHARGAMHARLHRYAEAEADLKSAMAMRLQQTNAQRGFFHWLGSPTCELIATWLQLSDLYRDTARRGEAIAVLNQTLAAYAQLDRYRADLHYREGYAEALEKLAGAYSDDGQRKPSFEAYRKALTAYEALAAAYPEISAYRRKQSEIESRLGLLPTAGSKRG